MLGLSACTNSRYQALFSDFSNGPGNEAKHVGQQLLVHFNSFVLSILCMVTLSVSDKLPQVYIDYERWTSNTDRALSSCLEHIDSVPNESWILY